MGAKIILENAKEELDKMKNEFKTYTGYIMDEGEKVLTKLYLILSDNKVEGWRIQSETIQL
jgi:hypothetical protein